MLLIKGPLSIREMLDISDRAYVIDKGSIVYKESAKDFSEDRDTMKEYLGV
jgi:ABC-type lipopolysaccharide export system ATPase subunit